MTTTNDAPHVNISSKRCKGMANWLRCLLPHRSKTIEDAADMILCLDHWLTYVCKLTDELAVSLPEFMEADTALQEAYVETLRDNHRLRVENTQLEIDLDEFENDASNYEKMLDDHDQMNSRQAETIRDQRTQLAGVDEVLARRPSLDNIEGRVQKINKAINDAALYDAVDVQFKRQQTRCIDQERMIYNQSENIRKLQEAEGLAEADEKFLHGIIERQEYLIDKQGSRITEDAATIRYLRDRIRALGHMA